jgi:signal transduction histidine kinase
LFRWECIPSGEIVWVEGAPRGPLIGRSIARAEEGEGVEQEVERAFAMRSPFRDARLTLPGEGTMAGEWKISGVPAFEPTDGRFAGYRGIALREANGEMDSGRFGQPGLLTDPNSLRELVHEIKTPLNAIIGFAEIIDAQLLGPADRHYRTRAAEIVAQARLLLSAIDDLDFAAKLQSDRNRPGSGTDLAMLLEQIAAGMRQGASAEAPQLELSIETRRRRCALEPALAERLVTRFCTAVLAAAADGEQIVVHLDNSNGRCLLWVRPPPGLDAANGDTTSGGFSLRLVRGLARIAGGDLTITRARITLALPEL